MVYLWKSPLQYDICTDEDDLSKYIGIYNSDKGPDKVILNSGLWEGTPWLCAKEDLEFKFNTSILDLVKYDVLENNGRFIIVNKRVRKILEAFAKDDVQFVPVTIICTNGTIDNYFAVNILSRVSGIDKEKSNIEWSYENRFMVGFGCGAGGLVYNHDCLGKHHIALEKEYTFVIVSQGLRDALYSMNPPIYEVDFVLPEETEW